jgi:XTP/dITP diphosphohydrolase
MPHSSVPAPRRRLVVATHNPGKLAEFRSLLAGLPFDLQSMTELGATSVEETGETFVANALLKARHAAKCASMRPSVEPIAALADDSGLEVDALNGAPGIFSARYAGHGADDTANNAKLIAAMAGLPMEARRARYRCALVFVFAADDARPLIAEGVWDGYILESPRGTGGFGYDPYFWLPELGLSAAELDPAEKNRLSHRGQALRELRRLLS